MTDQVRREDSLWLAPSAPSAPAGDDTLWFAPGQATPAAPDAARTRTPPSLPALPALPTLPTLAMPAAIARARGAAERAWDRARAAAAWLALLPRTVRTLAEERFVRRDARPALGDAELEASAAASDWRRRIGLVERA